VIPNPPSQGGFLNSLSEERRGQIEKSFSGVSSTHEYLERTSQVLALLSSGLGVALATATGSQVLEHIHFSRLATGRVLAVLVTQSGAVQDRVLLLDREMTHVELETAARYLNENFRGWPIERIRTEVARRMDLERAAYHQMLESIEELCRKGALAGDQGGPEIFVDGMANLIAAEVDRERLRQMLIAPARLGNGSLGTVALIAPTRIQYQQMIHAVRYIAGLSERLLEIPD